MKLSSYLWLLPFISFLGGYLVLAHLYHTDVLQAPSLVGMTLQEAFPLLSKHHLNARLLAVKQDPDLAEGTIMSQTPAATTAIKPNQTIHLVLSQKPPKHAAPFLLNKSKETVTLELQQRGIQHKIYDLRSAVPTHHCFGQFPCAGTLLDEKKMIAYCASDAPTPVLVPNFKEKPLPAALEFLTHHQTLYSISNNGYLSKGHACNERCVVTDQRPLAYSIVTRHEKQPLCIYLCVQHHDDLI